MGLFCCTSACSTNKKGPLSQKTLSFSSYKEALERWEDMNNYLDEGFCYSFEYAISEYATESIAYHLRGIDVSSHYSTNKPVLLKRGFYVHYSTTFYIYYRLKNYTINNDNSIFHWSWYRTYFKNKTEVNPEIIDERIQTSECGDYSRPTDCDTEYCLINSEGVLGLIVGFSTNQSQSIFNKYMDDILESFHETLKITSF